MFAESRFWKCEAFDANGSLWASSRTHTIGQVQALTVVHDGASERQLQTS